MHSKISQNFLLWLWVRIRTERRRAAFECCGACVACDMQMSRMRDLEGVAIGWRRGVIKGEGYVAVFSHGWEISTAYCYWRLNFRFFILLEFTCLEIKCTRIYKQIKMLHFNVFYNLRGIMYVCNCERYTGYYTPCIVTWVICNFVIVIVTKYKVSMYVNCMQSC